MAAAGSAIGLANLWKFPYVVGQNGGGIFILVYIVLAIFIGVPVLLGELAIGRHANKNPVGAFGKFDKRFKFIGLFAIIASALIPICYSVVGGWVIAYIFRFVTYLTEGIPADPQSHFESFISNSYEPSIWAAAFLGLNAYVVCRGIKNGIERFSKIMMPLLFIFLLALVVRSVTLPGAGEGLRFLFIPDFDKFSLKSTLSAMSLMFFSISLGLGIMITYGSYIPKSSNIIRSSVTVPLLDTMAALLSGLCVIPAVFAFGLEPTQGPTLTFITIPLILTKMPGGIAFGLIFFVLLLIAALSSAISLMEVTVLYLVEQWNLKRNTAVAISVIGSFLLSIPASLSFGPLSTYSPLKFLAIGPFANSEFLRLNFFDLADYVAQNIFIISASFLTCIFVGYIWRVDSLLSEVTNSGTKPFPLFGVWRFLIRYIAPLVILVVLLNAFGII